MHERDELWVVLGVEQVVFEDGKLPRVGKLIAFSVLLLQEGVNLRRGEFVRIPALNLGDDGIAGFDALPVGLTHQVSTDDALGHCHRALRRVKWSKVQFTGFQGFCEREQTTVLHDELGHWVVLVRKFVQGDGFTVLQTHKNIVAGHQLTQVDVVSLVNGGKRCGDDDADAGPTLALSRRLST